MISFYSLRSRNGLIIRVAIVLVIFVVLTITTYNFWSSDQQALKENGQLNFNTLPLDKLKDGLIVKGSIDMALDKYAEEYETNLGFRTSGNSELIYYVVPVYDKAEDGSSVINYLITYKAVPADFEAMDAIVAKTWNGSRVSAGLTVENARISKLPGKIQQYFTEWAHDTQFYENGSFIDWCAENNIFGTDDRAVIESKMVPYMINKTATTGMDPLYIWICLGVSVLMLIILLVLIFYKKPVKGAAVPDVMRATVIKR